MICDPRSSRPVNERRARAGADSCGPSPWTSQGRRPRTTPRRGYGVRHHTPLVYVGEASATYASTVESTSPDDRSRTPAREVTSDANSADASSGRIAKTGRDHRLGNEDLDVIGQARTDADRDELGKERSAPSSDAAADALHGKERSDTLPGNAAADALGDAVARWLENDLAILGEAGLREVLGATQHALDRLTGFRAKVAGVLEQRALNAAPPGGADQAIRGVRNRTANDLRLAPGEAKRAGETGRRMAQLPHAEEAMTSGHLPAEHARILGDTLRWLDPDVRAKVEPDLLDAALTENVITFGRTCRRLLAELDSEAANAEQHRRNARRRLRVTQTADGMVALHGQGSGISGEFVLTALHAFRKVDRSGNAEQATWDALERICRTALDAGTAPRNRNVRPHVLVTVPEPVAADRDGTGRGVAETAWSGPLPYQEVRRILSDADVSRVLIDAAGLPLEAGAAVRTVPAGLWKALQIRDRVCIADGCDVPAAWCQVMHLDVPYRLQGRLSLDNAAPGCSVHHRMLDQHGWQITWQNGRPILHHPDRAPPPNKPADHHTGPVHDNSSCDDDNDATRGTPTRRGDPPRARGDTPSGHGSTVDDPDARSDGGNTVHAGNRHFDGGNTVHADNQHFDGDPAGLGERLSSDRPVPARLWDVQDPDRDEPD